MSEKKYVAYVGTYTHGASRQGIHMAPSQFEAMFLSVAHTDEIIDQTLEAVRNYFTK